VVLLRKGHKFAQKVAVSGYFTISTEKTEIY